MTQDIAVLDKQVRKFTHSLTEAGKELKNVGTENQCSIKSQ
jgi:hypothetical protein